MAEPEAKETECSTSPTELNASGDGADLISSISDSPSLDLTPDKTHTGLKGRGKRRGAGRGRSSRGRTRKGFGESIEEIKPGGLALGSGVTRPMLELKSSGVMGLMADHVEGINQHNFYILICICTMYS